MMDLSSSLETRSDVAGLSGAAAMTSTPAAVAPLTSGKLKLLKMQLDELRQKEEEEREQNKDLEKLVKDLQRDLNQGCNSISNFFSNNKSQNIFEVLRHHMLMSKLVVP